MILKGVLDHFGLNMNSNEAANLIPATNTEIVQGDEALLLKERGNEYFRKGNLEEAYNLYSKSIDLKPDLNTYNNRAICNMRMKNTLSAIEDLNIVLQTDCNNVKALFRRAMCRKEMNNQQEELEDLFAILKIEPENSIARREFLVAKDKLFLEKGKNEEKYDETTKSNNNYYFKELYRGDIQACSSLMRNTSFENFHETVRDCGFSKEALSTIIEALCRKFDLETEWNLIYKYLMDIASLNCFNVLGRAVKSDSKFLLKQMLCRATSLDLDRSYKVSEVYKPVLE